MRANILVHQLQEMSKMKKINKFAALLLAAPMMFLAHAVHAEDPTATPGVDKRQANQERRIQQGVNSGALNEREAARLQRGEKRIERMEERAKADGKVTPEERKRLQRAENIQSRKIYREKHDKQRQ
jgi:hypothetical protein